MLPSKFEYWEFGFVPFVPLLPLSAGGGANVGEGVSCAKALEAKRESAANDHIMIDDDDAVVYGGYLNEWPSDLNERGPDPFLDEPMNY